MLFATLKVLLFFLIAQKFEDVSGLRCFRCEYTERAPYQECNTEIWKPNWVAGNLRECYASPPGYVAVCSVVIYYHNPSDKNPMGISRGCTYNATLESWNKNVYAAPKCDDEAKLYPLKPAVGVLGGEGLHYHSCYCDTDGCNSVIATNPPSITTTTPAPRPATTTTLAPVRPPPAPAPVTPPPWAPVSVAPQPGAPPPWAPVGAPPPWSPVGSPPPWSPIGAPPTWSPIGAPPTWSPLPVAPQPGAPPLWAPLPVAPQPGAPPPWSPNSVAPQPGAPTPTPVGNQSSGLRCYSCNFFRKQWITSNGWKQPDCHSPTEEDLIDCVNADGSPAYCSTFVAYQTPTLNPQPTFFLTRDCWVKLEPGRHHKECDILQEPVGDKIVYTQLEMYTHECICSTDKCNGAMLIKADNVTYVT